MTTKTVKGIKAVVDKATGRTKVVVTEPHVSVSKKIARKNSKKQRVVSSAKARGAK